SSRMQGDEIIPEIEFVDPDEADAYWITTCNMVFLRPSHGVPSDLSSRELMACPSGAPTHSLTSVKHLYSFKPRRHMEIVKDEASIAEECLRAFKRSWGRRVCDPIPPFPEDLFVVQDILRGGASGKSSCSSSTPSISILFFGRGRCRANRRVFYPVQISRAGAVVQDGLALHPALPDLEDTASWGLAWEFKPIF
ncbi:hypothetical protein HID58_042833, partial [Brassica napus]